MKLKHIIISIASLVAVATPVVVQSQAAALFNNAKQEACQGVTVGSTGCGQNPASLTDTIRTIVNILSIIVGVAAVIMVIVGGFKYVTSAGDSAKTSSARSTIVTALIGLVIVVLAQSLVQFVFKTATNTNTSLPQCPTGKTKLPNGKPCEKK